MARMVVIYRPPKNPESFDKHYFDVHMCHWLRSSLA
jgi:hypothetical protein